MFSKTELPSLDADALLKDYLFLDKSLIKGDDDGDACFKKFSNEGKGVSLKDRVTLNIFATLILDGKIKPQNWLAYVDLFTLYSNHLDQQRTGDKPSVKDKEMMVLHFLEAALSLSPKYNYDDLEKYSPRELSTHAQLLHYLGKARRYAQISPEERLPMLYDALNIARYLGKLECSEKEDPHAYKNRISTYELPVNYCLQDLKRFDEAAALIKPQLALPSAFHVTQAHTQLAKIYILKHQNKGVGIDDALSHARLAVEVSQKAGSKLLVFNAKVCLMETFQAADKSDEATILADSIVTEMDKNADCGAKPIHRSAAEKILEANRVKERSAVL